MAKPLRPKATRDSRSAAPKSITYQALASLNQYFEETLQGLDRLRELSLFDTRLRRETLETCQATIEETRAWLNFEITEALHEREEREWAYFGRIRDQAEKKFADPQDALLKADRMRRKSAVNKGGRR